LAWRSKRPVTVHDIGVDGRSSRRLVARRVGLRGAVAFPALHSNEVLAALEFYQRETAEPNGRIERTMVALGHELGEFFSRRRGELGPPPLTPRQLAVLQHAASGSTTPQIAAALGLRASTVRTHFDHIYEKLGVLDRAAAVAEAFRRGLIQ
jgi:DNA-binding NarL/FixJ family response regulator